VRINKRMHNKSFTADGEVAIVGGRNIGDEYFGANEAMNFADLDVAVIGPVVREVSDEFDLYWNNQSSIPMTALARQTTTPEQFATKRAALIAYDTTAERSAYAQSVRDSEFARQLRNRNVSYYWGRATIVSDHPDKVATSAARTETHLAAKLRQVVDATKWERSKCATTPSPRPSVEAHQGPRAELAADRESALRMPPRPPRRSHAPASRFHLHAAAHCCDRVGA
jgi:putative cardiolipin synthase